MSDFRLIAENVIQLRENYGQLALIEDFDLSQFDEGLGSIGKGATLLACIGACVLGLASKPAEAMSLTKPTENIEMTRNFENGNEKGTITQTQNQYGSNQFVTSDDGTCKKIHDISNSDGFSDEMYSLDCQSQNGAYTVNVNIHNVNGNMSDSGFSDNTSHNTISVEYNGGEKTVNLDDPNLKNLKNAVMQALQRDHQDNKIVTDMVNNTEMGAHQTHVDMSNNMTSNS